MSNSLTRHSAGDCFLWIILFLWLWEVKIVTEIEIWLITQPYHISKWSVSDKKEEEEEKQIAPCDASADVVQRVKCSKWEFRIGLLVGKWCISSEFLCGWVRTCSYSRVDKLTSCWAEKHKGKWFSFACNNVRFIYICRGCECNFINSELWNCVFLTCFVLFALVICCFSLMGSLSEDMVQWRGNMLLLTAGWRSGMLKSNVAERRLHESLLSIFSECWLAISNYSKQSNHKRY